MRMLGPLSRKAAASLKVVPSTIRHYSGGNIGGLTLSTILAGPPHISAVGPSRPHTACLQLSLPPFWTWTQAEDARVLSEGLASYLELVQREHHTPSVLFLRLFPDATVAQLSQRRTSPGTRTAATVAAHRLSLQAFVEAEHPWGSAAGNDPRIVFAKALAHLEQVVLPRFAGIPVVLLLPTRMLVTQSFCEKLCEVVSRKGKGGGAGPATVGNSVVGIAFELPPNETLYETDGGPQGHSFSWARLSLLTTPWDSLLRCDWHASELATPLRRHLTKDTVMPLHVLLPWMLQQRMLAHVEVSLVVDTILPPPGCAAARRAAEEGPDYFLTGLPVTRTRGTSPLPPAQDNDAVGEQAGRAFTVYMSEPTGEEEGSGGLTGAYAAATEALRAKGSGTVGNSVGRDTVDLASITESFRSQQQQLRSASTATATTPPSPSDGKGSTLLTLDAPPESLKRLIMASVVPDHPSSEAQHRNAIYEQFGRLIANTFEQEEAQNKKGDSEGRGSTGPGARVGSEEVEREMERLEALLSIREEEANPARAFADMQAAMARELAALQGSGDGMEGGSTSAPSMEATLRQWMAAASGEHGTDTAASHLTPSPSSWQDLHGYWACLCAMYVHVNHGEASTPPMTAITMPTFHAQQASAWASCFATRLPSSRRHVVPVTMPALSPTDLDTQRALREGRRARQESGGDCCRWLPEPTQAQLTSALAKLPARFTRQERLSAYQERQRAGGRAADSDSSSSSGGAAPCTIAFPGEDSEEEGSDEVVIRRSRTPRRPCWYGTPHHVAAEQTARLLQAVREERQEKGEAAPATVQDVRDVVADFTEGTMCEALRRFADGAGSPCGAVAMAVPPPGSSEATVQRSWQALTHSAAATPR